MAKEKLCPLLKKACIEHDCRWWARLAGTDAQGRVHDEYSCAIEWLPILILETSKEIRQGAAATESLRNENVAIGSALSKAISVARLT